MGIPSMVETLAGAFDAFDSFDALFFADPPQTSSRDGMPYIVNGQQSLSEHHPLLHI
jgi:hypothetical protein